MNVLPRIAAGAGGFLKNRSFFCCYRPSYPSSAMLLLGMLFWFRMFRRVDEFRWPCLRCELLFERVQYYY